jgi:hypothetical protein
LRRILEQAPTKRLRIMELRRILQALTDTERPDIDSLSDEEFIRDGHMLNMVDVLTGVVPLLPCVDETRANVLWDTLDTLRVRLNPHQVSPGARTAMVHAWKAYEDEFLAWESASGLAVFPRQQSGSLDRYRSRMQKLVGPIIQDITGERFTKDTSRGDILLSSPLQVPRHGRGDFHHILHYTLVRHTLFLGRRPVVYI